MIVKGDIFGTKRIASLQSDLDSAIENVEQLHLKLDDANRESVHQSKRISRLLHTVEQQDLNLMAYSGYVPKTRLWNKALTVAWLVAIGIFIGGVLVPHRNDTPTLEPDYSACISEYTYQFPLADKYQELVNALYSCGVYESAS